MKKAVVTGGTGFVGSWLIEYLLSQNVRVHAVVRDKNKLLPSFLLRKDGLFSCVEKDISLLIADDIPDIDWDCFFHLAWEGVSPEKKNNYKVQINNISTAMRMMELAKDFGCKKFIAAGTVAEYVFNDGVMDFSRKQTPNDFYGAAKVAAHFFLEVEASRVEVPFIWAVLPSTFGERRIDNNIITYTIRSLLNSEIPQYGDLSQMWDFLYVSEVVRALYLIGEKGEPGKTYGIGSGQYRTLKEYIMTIRDLINPQLPLGIGSFKYKTKQLMSSCVDISTLTIDTGFIPKVSFEEGISRTIEYMRNS